MDDDICVGVGDTYKSHFARSVAVSSHQVQRFGKDEGHLEVGRCDVDEKNFLGEPEEEETSFVSVNKLFSIQPHQQCMDQVGRKEEENSRKLLINGIFALLILSTHTQRDLREFVDFQILNCTFLRR